MKTIKREHLNGKQTETLPDRQSLRCSFLWSLAGYRHRFLLVYLVN